MKLSISLLLLVKLALLKYDVIISGNLISVDEDEDGHFYHRDVLLSVNVSDTGETPDVSNQVAQIFPSKDQVNLDSNGKVQILYHLTDLEESTLHAIFTNVTNIHNQKNIWPPLVLILLPPEVLKLHNNPFHTLRDFFNTNPLSKNGSSWNFPINSDLYIIYNPPENLTKYEIVEIYTIKNFTFVQKVENGLNQRGAINYYRLLEKDKRRRNFQAVPIVGLGVDFRGYEVATDFEDDNSTETRFAGGFEVLFYRYLRDALNFTEMAVKGLGYIREGPGGTLTGMAVQINNGNADISISSTEFLEYRVSGPDGISYLLPSFNLGMQAYFKQPPASSIRDVFTSAFSLQLWILLLALWVFICLSMHLAYRVYFRSKQIPVKDKLMSNDISIWSVGCMTQQGWHYAPQFTATRIIFFFGWFTGFMCYIAFSAQLVSILSIEVVPIKSFEDLIRDHFFIYNDDHIPTTKYFVKGLEQRGLIPTIEEDMRNVDIEAKFCQMISNRSAMVSVADSLFPILKKMNLSENYICSVLSDVRIGSRAVIMSMFVKRASPTRSIFNNKILLMIERGINRRILVAYFKEASVQCLRDGNSGLNNPLGSKDVFTAYAILLSGFVLSTSLVIVEHLFRKIWSNIKLQSPPPDPDLAIENIQRDTEILDSFSYGSPAKNIYNVYMKQRQESIISK